MKNHINAYWPDRSDASSTTDPDILALAEAVNVNIAKVNGESSEKPSLISDADKDYLRNVLIDAIIRTKDPLRYNLIICCRNFLNVHLQMPIDYRCKYND